MQTCIVGVFSALLLLCAAHRAQAQDTLSPVRVLRPGVEAPTFVLFDIADSTTVYTQNDFLGRYCLLDFWTTSCKPCLADLPVLHVRVGGTLESCGWFGKKKRMTYTAVDVFVFQQNPELTPCGTNIRVYNNTSRK